MSAAVKALVAYGSDTFAASPTFTDLGPADKDVVSAIRVNRGRQYITDRMDAGSCELDFYDTTGLLDPTNVSGPFYPMDPNCQANVQLYNPVAASYQDIFTGFVESIPTTLLHQGASVNIGTLDLVDMFALLALREVPPGLDFDATDTGASTANTQGDTTYAATDVQSRILAILADSGIPSALYDIFTGNVNLLTAIYSPGYQILAALQDCADAEFPGVANIYISRGGKLTFHGRKARFDYTNPTYGINVWKAGDAEAVAADSNNASIAVDGLTFDRDVTKIINSALAYPRGISPASISGTATDLGGGIWQAGQLIYVPSSGTQYGWRSWTATDLLTAGGQTDGLTGNEECQLFSKFYADNLSGASTRIVQARFNQIDPGAPNAGKHWKLLTEVELNDVVEITTFNVGGGGFSAEKYFVEGISYTIEPAGAVPQVTLALDLSPASYYNTDPFA